MLPERSSVDLIDNQNVEILNYGKRSRRNN